jgi:hypothetical protein
MGCVSQSCNAADSELSTLKYLIFPTAPVNQIADTYLDVISATATSTRRGFVIDSDLVYGKQSDSDA